MGCVNSKNTPAALPTSPSRVINLSQFARVKRDAAAGPRPVVVVFVCQGKDIKSKDLVGKSDTYVKVDVGAQSKKTAVYGNSSKPVWNTSLRFEGFSARPTEVTLTAMDRDRLSNDDVVGSVTLDLSQKWEQKEHEWEWVKVTKHGKAGDEVTGHLQIKVVAQYVDDTVDYNFAHYDYSHILEVTVKCAKNLRKSDVLTRNDAYTTVGYNTRQFKTRTLSAEQPEWNQKVLFFANLERESQFEIQFVVMDKDTASKDDMLGVAYFPIAKAVEHEGKAGDYWLPLRKKAETDKDLGDVSKEVVGGTRGALEVSVQLTKREEVQDQFFRKLLDEFDADNDGTLDKSEIDAMLEALGIELPHDQFEMFWQASDRDQSNAIDGDEAVIFLRCLLFQSPDTANRVLNFIVNGIESMRDRLMEVADPQRDENNIIILDRQTGILVKENIPVYIKVAIKSMFQLRAGRLVMGTHEMVNLLTKLSVKQGIKYDDPKSAADIPAFVKLHCLNLAEVDKPIEQYATFNEFFARGLKASARPIAEPNDPTIAVSPADCRMMVFPDLKEATDLWIKGDQFTIESVLGDKCGDLAARVKSGSMVIARLAPQDYHRWHFPIAGKLGRKVPIDGALYTVNPIAVNNNVNVYTMNKRVVCEIDSVEFGKVVMVAVGASMVGSIKFLADGAGTAFKKGDQHGYFCFGGSTVLVFFEKGRIEFDADLLANSRHKLETLIKCNARLGKATGPADAQAAAAAEAQV